MWIWYYLPHTYLGSVATKPTVNSGASPYQQTKCSFYARWRKNFLDLQISKARSGKQELTFRSKEYLWPVIARTRPRLFQQPPWRQVKTMLFLPILLIVTFKYLYIKLDDHLQFHPQPETLSVKSHHNCLLSVFLHNKRWSSWKVVLLNLQDKSK